MYDLNGNICCGCNWMCERSATCYCQNHFRHKPSDENTATLESETIYDKPIHVTENNQC